MNPLLRHLPEEIYTDRLRIRVAKRVCIRCDSANQNSRAVAVRAGFQLEGILKNDEWSVDKTMLTDTAIYAKTVE